MGIIFVSGAALLGGFVLGRETAPAPSRDQNVLVTRSADPKGADQDYTAMIAEEPAGPRKEYTQIVDVSPEEVCFSEIASDEAVDDAVLIIMLVEL